MEEDIKVKKKRKVVHLIDNNFSMIKRILK